MSEILKPIYLVPDLGEYAVIPDGAIINIGGVSNSTFTVGGKPLLFADGSPSDGSSTSGLRIDFQRVYNNSSGEAFIDFTAGKNLVLQSVTDKQFTFDADTGKVTITGGLEVLGLTLINGINLVDLRDTLVSHIDAQDASIKHSAAQVSIDGTGLSSISGTTIQEVIESIDSRLSNPGVVGFEHIQTTPAATWTINHSKGSKRVQISIWDDADQLLFADEVSITDSDTVTITFNTPVSGRAILMIF